MLVGVIEVLSLLEHVPHPAAGHDGELAGEGGHHKVADAQQLGVDDGRVPRVGPLHLTESNIKIKNKLI